MAKDLLGWRGQSPNPISGDQVSPVRSYGANNPIGRVNSTKRAAQSQVVGVMVSDASKSGKEIPA
jgi:hypothetical protein